MLNSDSGIGANGDFQWIYKLHKANYYKICEAFMEDQIS